MIIIYRIKFLFRLRIKVFILVRTYNLRHTPAAAHCRHKLAPRLVKEEVNLFAVLFAPLSKAAYYLRINILPAQRKFLLQSAPVSGVLSFQILPEQRKLKFADSGTDNDHVVMLKVKECKYNQEKRYKEARKYYSPLQLGKSKDVFVADPACLAVLGRRCGNKNHKRLFLLPLHNHKPLCITVFNFSGSRPLLLYGIHHKSPVLVGKIRHTKNNAHVLRSLKISFRIAGCNNLALSVKRQKILCYKLICKITRLYIKNNRSTPGSVLVKIRHGKNKAVTVAVKIKAGTPDYLLCGRGKFTVVAGGKVCKFNLVKGSIVLPGKIFLALLKNIAVISGKMNVNGIVFYNADSFKPLYFLKKHSCSPSALVHLFLGSFPFYVACILRQKGVCRKFFKQGICIAVKGLAYLFKSFPLVPDHPGSIKFYFYIFKPAKKGKTAKTCKQEKGYK